MLAVYAGSSGLRNPAEVVEFALVDVGEHGNGCAAGAVELGERVADCAVDLVAVVVDVLTNSVLDDALLGLCEEMRGVGDECIRLFGHLDRCERRHVAALSVVVPDGMKGTFGTRLPALVLRRPDLGHPVEMTFCLGPTDAVGAPTYALIHVRTAVLGPISLACVLQMWVPDDDDDDEEQPWRSFTAEITAFCDDDPQQRPIGYLRGVKTFSPDAALTCAADGMSDELATLAVAAEQVLWDEMETVDTVMLLEMAVLERPFRGQGLAWECIAEALRTVDARTAPVTLQPEPQREGGGPIEDDDVRGPALERLCAAWASYGFNPNNDGLTVWRWYERHDA